MKPEPVLSFEHFVARYAPMMSGSPENCRYFQTKAMIMYVLHIERRARDTIMYSVCISETSKDEHVKHYILYGVSRRAQMIWDSFRAIKEIAAPDRTAPLLPDESRSLMKEVNLLYVNLVGILDNYAWALLHATEGEKTLTRRPMSVGLFSDAIVRNAKLSSIADSLSRFKDWNNELRERRNPAAHRMPLTIPPAVLLPSEAAQLRELSMGLNKAWEELDFSKIDEITQKQASLGTFLPAFSHDPRLGMEYIYPTIPNDIGNMAIISQILNQFLVDGSA
jgi:hypothetical protein